MDTVILPGVYIDVLAEGLIAPGQVTVGNLGVIGTAAKGPLNQPTLLATYNDAVAIFGPYDSFIDPNNPTRRRQNALTLVRALELAFSSGATTVFAMRVAAGGVAAATATLQSASGQCVLLTAASPGSWGNAITATVAAAEAADIRMAEDVVTLTAAQAVAKQVPLTYAATASARNRVIIRKLDGTTTAVQVVDAAPAPGQAQFAGNTLDLGDNLVAGDVVTVDYRIDPTVLVAVTVALGNQKEVYLANTGTDLISQVNDPQTGSTLVTASVPAGGHPTERPSAPQSLAFGGGDNGAAFNDYSASTYDPLLDVDAHIILAAGQNNAVAGAGLDAHCQKASTDVYKRDRIAVVGSDFATAAVRAPTLTEIDTYVDKLIGNTLGSDRVVFVAPGIVAFSAAAEDQVVNPITLPGAYTAAVIAGMLAATPPHISLTNKNVAVVNLEAKFNTAQLTELVQNRVTALEINRGIRVLRGQTTDDRAFREITTRRIVDFAKFGVRSAASPFIGLLNNDRVRSALRTTINSFLKQMQEGEMLVGYSLDVSATRDQQIAGIVQVTMTLQPVFSINFIQVTMILS